MELVINFLFQYNVHFRRVDLANRTKQSITSRRTRCGGE
jgi:hypothetical protein